MRLVFHGRHDFHESLEVGGGHATRDGLLQVGEMSVHASGQVAALRRRRDHERPAVGGPDRARDEAALGEPIENARERRSFVSESAVELGNRRRRGGGEQRENVRLALREAVLTQIGEIQPDPVRRSMDRWNQT
jgi:hypothetical protein